MDDVYVPWWLRRCRCTTYQTAQGHDLVQTVQKECYFEVDSSGAKVKHCKEVVKHFRQCVGRQVEEVSSSVTETHERVGEDPPATQQGVHGSLPGQLLEELWALAAELKEDLIKEGTQTQERPRRRGILERLFNWREPPDRDEARRRAAVSPSSLVLQRYALPQQDV